MRSMYQVLSKQEHLQVASEGGTVEIRVSQFIRQCIPSCRRRRIHGKGTTTIRVQLEPWYTLYTYKSNISKTVRFREKLLKNTNYTRSTEWYHFQWPWVTCDPDLDPTPMIFGRRRRTGCLGSAAAARWSTFVGGGGAWYLSAAAARRGAASVWS